MKVSLLLLFLLIYNYPEAFSKKKKRRCRKGYAANEPILVVISFDGFKTQYINSTYETLTEKFQEGVKTEFKSLRFANALNVHHTIATGRFPNKHGVFAANWSRKDHKIIKFDIEQYENELTKNNNILPIWTLNDMNGGTSACMMWPGCQYRYGPDHEMSIFQHAYNQTEDYTSRLSKVIEWMNESVTLNPPNLVLIYFEQPDKLAHVYGPNATNLHDEIKKLDEFVKEFEKKLKLLKLWHRVDIVFVSDHRLTEIRYKDILDLRNRGVCNDVGLWGSDVWLQQQYFSRTAGEGNRSLFNGEYVWNPHGCKYGYFAYGKWIDVYYACFVKSYNMSKCLEGIYEVTYFNTSKKTGYKDNNAHHYQRGSAYNHYPFEMICKIDHGKYVEIPDDLIANYTILVASTNSSRFRPVVEGNIYLNYAAYGEMLYPKIRNWSAHYNFEVDQCTKFGVHGYNFPETGFFLALGPSFIKNATVAKFEVQDLYSLFAKVLKIEGDFNNDGNFTRVKPVLNPMLLQVGKQDINWLQNILLIVICAVFHCILFLVAVVIFLARKRRKRNRRQQRRQNRRDNKLAKRSRSKKRNNPEM